MYIQDHMLFFIHYSDIFGFWKGCCGWWGYIETWCKL